MARAGHLGLQPGAYTMLPPICPLTLDKLKAQLEFTLLMSQRSQMSVVSDLGNVPVTVLLTAEFCNCCKVRHMQQDRTVQCLMLPSCSLPLSCLPPASQYQVLEEEKPVLRPHYQLRKFLCLGDIWVLPELCFPEFLYVQAAILTWFAKACPSGQSLIVCWPISATKQGREGAACQSAVNA